MRIENEKGTRRSKIVNIGMWIERIKSGGKKEYRNKKSVRVNRVWDFSLSVCPSVCLSVCLSLYMSLWLVHGPGPRGGPAGKMLTGKLLEVGRDSEKVTAGARGTRHACAARRSTGGAIPTVTVTQAGIPRRMSRGCQCPHLRTSADTILCSYCIITMTTHNRLQ